MCLRSSIRIETKPILIRDDRFQVTHRQELIQGWDQRRLMQSKVLIIGAGGIGGEVGEGVVRKGVGHLTLLDHDIVEDTNLNRQHFFAEDVGNTKAISLARNLAKHCPHATVIEGHPFSFQDAVAIDLDLSPSIVVCGVDNAETRIAVSHFFRTRRIPVVFVSVDLLAECGQVFVQESKPESACFGCAFPNSINGRKAPCFIPAVKDVLKTAAGLALYAMDSLVMARKRNWNYRRIHLAGYAPDVACVIQKSSACPLCNKLQQGSPAVATDSTPGFFGDLPLTPS